jgi:hypothetical protein
MPCVNQSSIDLNRSQENNPEQIFTEEITESMKNFFEKNSQCEVSNTISINWRYTPIH